MSKQQLSIEEAKEKGLTSMDIPEEKREQLKQLFPEVFTEDKIDFDQLKRVLGDFVEADKERFGLNWPGKADCMKVIQQPSVATLKPDRGESVKFDDTQNLFIEGDNLEVLKLLQKAYFGKLKMIYIDPPYNTGGDFIYPDKFAENLDTYLEYTGQKDSEGRKFSTNADTSGRYHSNWINMMYPRLYLAKNLLSKNGVIFISIDNKEYSNLKAVCDLIFGEENFIEAIIWRKKSGGGQQDEYIVTEHDYIICYAKSREDLFFSERKAPPKMTGYNCYDERKKRNYKQVKLAKWGSAALREDRPTMYDYPELIDPEGKKCLPVAPDGRPGRWRYGRQRAIEMLANDDIDWVNRDGNWIPYEKDYEPLEDEGISLKERSIFYDLVENTSGSNELTQIFGAKDVFQNPKPTDLLSHLIYLVSKPEDEDIIIDFFAGSGSSAHAVMSMNNIDEGNRKFINVQLPEKLDEKIKEHATAISLGFSNIAEVAKERIRRAAKKIEEENPDYKGDLGFKVFKLAQSNFNIWQGNTEEIDDMVKQLEMAVDHIKDESTPEDILYELLLKAGFQLTTKVKKITMAGKEVFSIEDGAMLICLEKQLTQEVLDAMADAEPFRVVCLDEGFKGNDELKTNAVQTFKSRARDKESAITFTTV